MIPEWFLFSNLIELTYMSDQWSAVSLPRMCLNSRSTTHRRLATVVRREPPAGRRGSASKHPTPRQSPSAEPDRSLEGVTHDGGR